MPSPAKYRIQTTYPAPITSIGYWTGDIWKLGKKNAKLYSTAEEANAEYQDKFAWLSDRTRLRIQIVVV